MKDQPVKDLDLIYLWLFENSFKLHLPKGSCNFNFQISLVV